MWLAIVGCASPEPSGTVPAPAAPEPVEVGTLVFDGPPPRNVLLLSLDTLRRDRVDLHATDGVARTPFLAELLAEGVVLDDHQQCSNWTLHAMSCTLLGHPVEDLGWVARLDGLATPLPEAASTLAERLAAAGWHAEVASSNGYFGEEWGSTQGYGPDRSAAVDALTVGEDGLAALRLAVAADPDRPWLLHLHAKEPHDPYDPPAAYLAELAALPPIPYDLSVPGGLTALARDWATLDEELRALARLHVDLRYSGDVRWLDDQLAALWATLEAEGWLDDALVVVFTDHGEAIFEHGHRDHARALYREENDAVLAFWAKNLRPATWTGPTHAVDLVPTVLAVLGLPADPALPGAIVGTADPERPRFATTAGFLGPMAAVTVGGEKLVYRFDGTLERYDLASDPAEAVDLHAPGDPRSAELWALLAPTVAALDAALPDATAVPP